MKPTELGWVIFFHGLFILVIILLAIATYIAWFKTRNLKQSYKKNKDNLAFKVYSSESSAVWNYRIGFLLGLLAFAGWYVYLLFKWY